MSVSGQIQPVPNGIVNEDYQKFGNTKKLKTSIEVAICQKGNKVDWICAKQNIAKIGSATVLNQEELDG